MACLSLSVTSGDRRKPEHGLDGWFGGDLGHGGDWDITVQISRRGRFVGLDGLGPGVTINWLR